MTSSVRSWERVRRRVPLGVRVRLLSSEELMDTARRECVSLIRWRSFRLGSVNYRGAVSLL